MSAPMQANQQHKHSGVAVEKCAICLDPLRDVAVLSCRHLFCTSCIKECAAQGIQECPVCRAPMKELESFHPPLWKSPQQILADYYPQLPRDNEPAYNAPRHGRSVALWLWQLQRCLALHAERTGAPLAQLHVLEMPAPPDNLARVRQTEQERADRTAAQQMHEEDDDAEMDLDDEGVEDVVCEQCKRGDDEPSLLLCSGCDAGCHTWCLTPALAEVPHEDWFCRRCVDAAPASSAAAAASQRRTPPVRDADDSGASVDSRNGDEQDADFEFDSHSDTENDSDSDSSCGGRAPRGAQSTRRCRMTAKHHAVPASAADPAAAHSGAQIRITQVAAETAEPRANAFAAGTDAFACQVATASAPQQQHATLLPLHAAPVTGIFVPAGVKRTNTAAAAAACHSARTGDRVSAARDALTTMLRGSLVPAVPAVVRRTGVPGYGQQTVSPLLQMQAALPAYVLRDTMTGQLRALLRAAPKPCRPASRICTAFAT